MIDPVAFSLGSLEIRWYGLIFAFGFLLGIPIITKLGKEKGITKDQVYDFFVYLTPSSVIGARLLSVLLNFSYYQNDLIKIFYIWEGGMAFHGGLIGGLIGAYLFTKKYKINFYNLADLTVIPLALGLALGRIGNFINQEFYGTLTNLPWGVEFDKVQGKRHPVQLYESLKNIFIFFILLKLNSLKKIKKGVIFWSFILLYSLLRFLLEFFKEDTLHIGNLTYGQIIGIPLFFISIIMLIKIGKSK